MTTLRFHNDLYSKDALDEASRVFAEHAELDRLTAQPYEEVAITASSDDSEADLAGEFANYVLALTIERNRS